MKFSLKNKNLEALLRGYIKFNVNGKKFNKYNDAKLERIKLCANTRIRYIEFTGYNVFKRRWLQFYVLMR